MNFSKPRHKGTRGRSSSFRRSLAYVLHDKDGTGTERVGMVALINLAVDDPHLAASEMQTTADAAKALQARSRTDAGKRAQASGRDTKNPVYTFTLSWHPSDSPSANEMLATARDALKVLNLQDHQVVVAEHRDRPHKHVHVIVNLVHPDTGKVANLRHDERKLDAWAHQYEARTMIRSFKRSAKHEGKPRLSDAAQRKADLIRKARNEKVQDIKDRQALARTQIVEENSKIWTEYREERQAIYNRYKPLLAQAWARKMPSLGMSMKPGAVMFPKMAEWMQLAKAMKPHLGHRAPSTSRVFDRAQEGFVPHNTPNQTTRIFQWSKDAATKRDLRPLAHGKLIQPGRPWLNRKERADQLKLARSAELSALALGHQRRIEDLEKAQIITDKAFDQEWKTLRDQSVKIWANWKAEFKPGKEMDFKVITTMSRDAWQKGSVEPGGYTFSAKVYGLPSEHGIDNGHISKLDVRDATGKEIMSYDRCWVKEPAGLKNALILKAITHAYGAEFAAKRLRLAPVIEKEPTEKTDSAKPLKQQYRIEANPDEIKAQFREAIRAAGLNLEDLPEMDGQMHYVPLIGQTGTKKSGGYRGWLNGHPAGAILNYKTGVKITWKAEGEMKPISHEQKELFRMEAKAQNEARNTAKQAAQDNAALKARLIMEQTTPASPNHPYLLKKGIERHGIRQDVNGNLVIPLSDKMGRLRNLQTIGQDGMKLYQKDAQKTGTFFVLGSLSEERPIIVVEGFATGATLYQATGHGVVVALDTTNLKAVGQAIRENYPEAEIIFAADDDRHLLLRDTPLPNVGREKAEEAAREIGATVTLPQFAEGEAGSDWNDYSQIHGLKAVASYFPSIEPENARDGAEMAVDPPGYDRD